MNSTLLWPGPTMELFIMAPIMLSTINQQQSIMLSTINQQQSTTLSTFTSPCSTTVSTTLSITTSLSTITRKPLAELVVSEPRFSTLLAAVKAADLVETLNG